MNRPSEAQLRAHAHSSASPAPGAEPGPPEGYDADPRPYVARALAQLAALLAAVEPGRLGEATPCDEYDVGALARHVVAGARRMAHVAEGGAATDVPPLAEDVPDVELAAAYRDAGARLNAAWADDALLDATAVLPFGEVPGRGALAVHVMEAVTHTWDLARALGRTEPLDEELGRCALATARRALGAERRGPGVPFDEVRTAPEGADVHTELAEWLGRRTQDWPAGGRR